MSHTPAPPDLTERVIRIVADGRQCPPEAVTLDSTFDELGIDSLGAVAILGEIEEGFGIEVPNELVFRIRSVRDVVTALAPLVGGASAGTPPGGASNAEFASAAHRPATSA